MSLLLTLATKMAVSKVLHAVTTEAVDAFIEEEKPTVDTVTGCNDFENKIVDWLNQQIDIPFLSEEVEEVVLHACVDGIKSMVLMRLS